MPRWIAAVAALALVMVVSPAQAGEPKGKLIWETWDAAYLEGSRAGFVHTTTHEFEQAGQKILRTTIALQLKVKRFKQVIDLRGQVGTDELRDGTVLGTFTRQAVAQGKDLTIIGTVKGKQIEFLLDGKANAMKPAPWDDRVFGLWRQSTLLADKKVRPGDKFAFLTFEPSVNLVVRLDVKVLDYETVDIPGSKTKQKLLRAELVPEKLEGVKLPTLVQWLDADLNPVRQDTEMPGLGQITLVRTTREVALAPGAEATLTDIGIGQLIRLNKKVLNPLDTKSAVYRITVKGDDDAAAAFVQDERQVVKVAKGATFEMHVTASKGLKKGLPAGKAADEFIQSSYFITSADPKVQELARKAVGKETDPWRKALLIEKWVHANMIGTNDEALAPADQVARTLKGDCTEYAMLTAAMCRAQGIPSRTAIGLIYTDTKMGPAMGFHMWTEVWVENQWAAVDATLGRGYVGATHLKVTDHSWHDTRALTPLLPLMRVVGKMQVEVVEAR